MSKLVTFSSFSNPLGLRQPGDINKDPTVWLDGGRPPLSMFPKIIRFWQTKKFDQTQTLWRPPSISDGESRFYKNLTQVLMLTTNMIRKDLNSQNMYDAGVALSSLACFISPDLARDLSNDVMSLLTSTKPYIRKKAVLILYKVFLRWVNIFTLNIIKKHWLMAH